MQEIKLFKETEINEKISKYYDYEMNDLELVNFEAEMALSRTLYKKCSEECFKNFKISNSIKLVKLRQDLKAQKAVQDFENKYDKLLVNIDTVGFKSFYKHLRNCFLNMLRDDS